MPHDTYVLLGGAGVDTVVYVPELPLPYADSYLIDSGIRTNPHPRRADRRLRRRGAERARPGTHHLDLLGDDP